MFICCECCVLSGRGLCNELITRPRKVLLTVVRRVWSRKPQEWGGHDLLWVAERKRKKTKRALMHTYS
jgi:hypothetical protein